MAVELSIVMPVFNSPELTIEMIGYIRANTYSDWELWAVDDGSDEESWRKIAEYCDDDERIHYIHREEGPKGAQTCRNIGMRWARGEYIIFFDSDDYLTPDCLKHRVDAIRGRSDVDFLVFPSGVVENGRFDDGVRKFVYGYDVFDDDVECFCRRLLPFVVWNNIYRTESLRQRCIEWDVRLKSLQDADFNLSTILSGMRYDYVLGMPNFGYRIDANAGSVSKKALSAEHKSSHLYAIDKFYRMVQAQHGHKYDSALYHGVLFLYNWIFTEDVDFEFANAIADVIHIYNSKNARDLRMKICATKLLKTVLPVKVARQLPMYFHLKDYYRREAMKLAAITEIRQRVR